MNKTDLLTIFGFLMLTTGLAIIHYPTALIISGTILFILGLTSAYIQSRPVFVPKTKNSTPDPKPPSVQR